MKITKKMYKSVEEYAENQELWIDDFLRAWSKTQSNGYSNLRDSPTGCWSHKCCFYREIALMEMIWKNSKLMMQLNARKSAAKIINANGLVSHLEIKHAS